MKEWLLFLLFLSLSTPEGGDLTFRLFPTWPDSDEARTRQMLQRCDGETRFPPSN